MIDSLIKKPYKMIEFPHFVSEKELDYNIEYAKAIIDGNWVKKNWHSQIEEKQCEVFLPIAKKIIEHGGVIVEIAAGPGGGFMPAILNEDINANIIISDLCPTVVREWKNFFESNIKPPNIFYTAFNNCDMPFKDNSIDVVSAGGGFGNTEGDKVKVLSEIYRVLKPGGLYVSGDGYVTKEYLNTLPKKVQKIFIERFPTIFMDFYDEARKVGFRSIDNEITGTWSTKGDDSSVATLAKELGVEINFSSYIRYCIK